ncbi:hypothetical protein IID10_00140 [candidate division KSB1 bacterium]|nr:hypothetical protein [candidate division KSB1 bacterium]TDI92771.1 MAG: hypothetical protein E2O77_04315 [Caldithrix sp.]
MNTGNKILFMIILCLLMPLGAFAQNKDKIEGPVKDKLLEQLVGPIVCGIVVIIVSNIGFWIFGKSTGKINILENRVNMVEADVKALWKVVEKPNIITPREKDYDLDGISITALPQSIKSD